MKTLLLTALLAGSATAATAADCHLDLDQAATARWACGQAAGMGSQDHASVVEATFRPICDDAERFDSSRGRCVACPDRGGGTRPFYVDPASGRLFCQIHALEPDRTKVSTVQRRYTYERPADAGEPRCVADFGWLGRYDESRKSCVACPPGFEFTGNALDSGVACRRLPACVTSLRHGHYGWHCGRWNQRVAPDSIDLAIDEVDCACREARLAEGGGADRLEFQALLERLEAEGAVGAGPEREAFDFFRDE